METFDMTPPGFVELSKEEIEDANRIAAEVCRPLWAAINYSELEKMITEVETIKQKLEDGLDLPPAPPLEMVKETFGGVTRLN